MEKMVKKIKIDTEFITLGQFLKFADVITNGGEAKEFIMSHSILVNDVDCKMRGKKIRPSDKIIIDNSMFFEIE